MTLADKVAASRLPPGPIRRSIRLAAGVTLREVAEEMGVSVMAVHRWENGAEPNRERAMRYRKLLDALTEAARG